MSLNSISRWYVIGGILIIWTVKLFVRPFVPLSDFWQLFVDIIPNLIGTFLLPFGAWWWFKKIFSMTTIFSIRFACLTGFVLVVINEYIQLIPLFGRTFDYWDILASIPGTLLGHAAFVWYWERSYANEKTAD